MPCRRIALALTATLALAGTASAEPVPFDGAWKEQRFSLFSKNRYNFGGGHLDVTSNGSVSMAYLPLEERYWNARTARWAWSVSTGVPATDLTLKGGDDRNLALYAVFMPEQDAQTLKGASIRKLLEADNARVLIYVWGGAHARGDVLASPYLGARGKTVILRGSETGQHSENVDFARDFARAFGGDLPALVGLAVSADSDDTKSGIVARIEGLTLQ